MASRKPPKSPRKGTRRKRPRGRPEWADEFLDNLMEQGGEVIAAARMTGVSPRAVYDLRYDDEGFEKQMDAARKKGRLGVVDELEESALARAARGYLEPVYYKGERVGARRRFDAVREIFFLKTHRPEKYNIAQGDQNPGGGDSAERTAALIRDLVHGLLGAVPQAPGGNTDAD